MTSKTHDVIAFSSLLTLSVMYQPNELTILTLFSSIIGNIVGALIPDMDQAGNRLWDLLPAGNFTGRIFRRIFYKHRTLTHSILGAVLIFKLFEWVLPKLFNPDFVDPKMVLWSVMIGYISHLVADSLTEEGLPLFFPIDFNVGFPPVRKMRIVTGKWFENLVVFPAVWIYILWFLFTYQSEVARILRLI